MLNTPVIGVKKNNKLQRWYYNLMTKLKLNLVKFQSIIKV